ncbi:hypothetical protein D9M71_399660 [compost metagenome]
MLGRRAQFQAEQAQVAQLRQCRAVVGKQPGDPVGKAHGQHLIQTLAGQVALQLAQIAQPRTILQQGLGQRHDVAQGKVVALAGNRVRTVGSVADQHQMAAHLLLGLEQRQRVAVPHADLAEGPEAIAERLLQLGEEAALVQRQQARGVGIGAGPDQRATVVRQRQQGHRPVRREAFEGLPAVRLGRADIGDQRGLSIWGTAQLDAQLLAQVGTATVGQHQQLAVQRTAVVEGQPVAAGLRLHRLDPRRTAPVEAVGMQRLPQAVAEPGVFHHIAQGRHALFRGGQSRGAEAATLGDLDAGDRLGALGDRRPQAEALVDQPGAPGQRRAARVVAGLEAVAGGVGFDQADLPAPRQGAALLQGQGQAGADQAATDDGNAAAAGGMSADRHRLRPPGCARQPSAPRSRRPSWVRRR